MAQLVAPSTRVHRSFLAATEEFQGEGRARELVLPELVDPSRFAAYVGSLLAEARPETPRPPGWVPSTHLWFVDGEEYLGRVSIRHSLTDWLRRIGGHIGYEVRPTARRQGHATTMLALALPVAASLGIDPALVTCDPDNTASRRVIEANGGRFEEAGDGKLRFWVPTGGPSRGSPAGPAHVRWLRRGP
jgi:predicted acetyltransferase